MIREFIESVVEEKNGFSFDRPHRLGEKSLSVLVPVIRKADWKRDYITLSETKNVSIKDTGNIDFVNVQNNEDTPLYVSRGSIFKGDTQERAAIHGYIIKPNSNLNIAVRCVHQTKDISGNADMEYVGGLPYSIDLSKQDNTWNTIQTYVTNYNKSINPDYYGSVTSEVNGTGNITMSHDCHTIVPAVWEGDCIVSSDWVSYSLTGGNNIVNLDCSTQSFGSFNQNNSDDLVGTLGELSENIKEAMRNIPYIENQVGGVFMKGSGEIIGLDIYDISKSWQSMKNDTIKKEGASFINDDDDLFVMRPDKAGKLISKILSNEFTEKIVYSKDYSVVEVRYENLIGETVVFNNQVIHLTLWRK